MATYLGSDVSRTVLGSVTLILSSGLSYRNNAWSISPILFEVGSVDTPWDRRVLHTVLASL